MFPLGALNASSLAAAELTIAAVTATAAEAPTQAGQSPGHLNRGGHMLR